MLHIVLKQDPKYLKEDNNKIKIKMEPYINIKFCRPVYAEFIAFWEDFVRDPSKVLTVYMDGTDEIFNSYYLTFYLNQESEEAFIEAYTDTTRFKPNKIFLN